MTHTQIRRASCRTVVDDALLEPEEVLFCGPRMLGIPVRIGVAGVVVLDDLEAQLVDVEMDVVSTTAEN